MTLFILTSQSGGCNATTTQGTLLVVANEVGMYSCFGPYTASLPITIEEFRCHYNIILLLVPDEYAKFQLILVTETASK